jgi:hypothetical protein
MGIVHHLRLGVPLEARAHVEISEQCRLVQLLRRGQLWAGSRNGEG